MVPMASRALFAATCVALIGLPCGRLASAQGVTYDVDVQPTLNDLPIKIESVPFDGRLVMKLTNSGTLKARCELRYDASPQPIGRSYVYVKPGETVEDSFPAKRKWFDVTVGVTCKPTDK